MKNIHPHFVKYNSQFRPDLEQKGAWFYSQSYIEQVSGVLLLQWLTYQHDFAKIDFGSKSKS
jgi:hypothetical protein